MSEDGKALIFDIQRFSMHDGPGIRTVVFFKGCSLDCRWCHNPEAVKAHYELAYYADRCIEGCRDCLPSCPEQALDDRIENRVDFSRCTDCGDCVDVCPADALSLVGRRMNCEDLLGEIEKDRSFFASSGGGVTLSGGEPVLQWRFLADFLPLLRERGIHTAIETCGAYPRELIQSVAPLVDLVLFDLKIMDSDKHRQLTGKRNEEVLANLRYLAGQGAALEVRMPVVPELNTSRENIEATCRFLAEAGIERLTLLPYNHLWEAKLPRLASNRKALGIAPPDGPFYGELSETFSRMGLEATV